MSMVLVVDPRHGVVAVTEEPVIERATSDDLSVDSRDKGDWSRNQRWMDSARPGL